MGTDLQKASLWKRIAAWMLDAILLGIVAVGCAYGLSAALGYDGYNTAVEEAYSKYESEYGIVFDIDAETYEQMTEQELENYQKAYEALISDEETMHAYNMVINLALLITTGGILAGTLLLDFAVPLIFKNGVTVGKKVFGLGLVRADCVKISTMQLFVRALIGKFTVETMIPVYLVLMIFGGMMDITGTIVICGIGITQVVLYCVTRNNTVIHDAFAGTVVVDLASQRIFDSTDELIEYEKKLHAEQVARQDY